MEKRARRRRADYAMSILAGSAGGAVFLLGIRQDGAPRGESGRYRAGPDRCPYLDEPLTQYCSAAPVVKYIRYSEALLSRCGSDRYRYCELYLALANPAQKTGDLWAGDISVPGHLLYSSNHMWFDPGAGETWHVGIDAFLAKVLGTVERITFLTTRGSGRPTAVLTVRGMDLQIVFPCMLPVASAHEYLRARPAALTSDPYGEGWLFEGNKAEARGLLNAPAAAEWMRGEVDRLSEFVGYRRSPTDHATCADGGVFVSGLLAHLNREEVLQLFQEFFSPYGEWEKHS
jgi:glycine cleavage system H protein